MMRDLKARLVQEALDAGFVACRICAPDAVPHVRERLAQFIAAGYHGDMRWMEDRMAWRADPRALWPEVRTVVMMAESYTPKHDPLENLAHSDKATISVYAQGRDYHDVVKKRLKRVARWFMTEANELSPQVKVFVDTAPVSEKALAQAAGLGWQGKHTNLLSRDWGNWAFLGAIFTTVALPHDTAETDHCGTCRACLDICPTNAFPAPYQLDARRCISYLTIEYKGPVPTDLRPALGNRIYGCDDCLAVCPWNKFARAARDQRLIARDDLRAQELSRLAALDDGAFRELFSGTPIKRIGRNRFVRNVLYAIGNSARAELQPVAQALCHDPDPVVADAAVWAVSRLSAP